MWHRSNALILAAALAAPATAQQFPLQAAPDPALPDLRIERLTLSPDCRVTVTIASGALSPKAHAVTTLALRTDDGGRRLLPLGQIDPDKTLTLPKGRLSWTSDLLISAEATRVTAWIDTGERVREDDERNNRRNAILRCPQVPPEPPSAPEGTPPQTVPEELGEPPAPTTGQRPPVTGGGLFDIPIPPPPEPLPAAAAAGNDSEAEPGELLLLSADMAEARTLARRAAELGLRVKSRRALENLGLVATLLRLPPDTGVAEAMELLRRHLPPERHWQVAPNHRYRLQSTNDDPRHYGPRLVGWNQKSRCGEGIRLGLIDSAIDTAHPDLAGADIRARRFVTTGIPLAPPDHATAIAARLLADPAAGGVAGLLPGARLYAANAFRLRDGIAETTTAWLLAALDWLAGEAVTVVNLSFAGPRNPLLATALDRLMARGTAVAAAAGNDGPGAPPRHPAAHPGVVAVTALDADLAIWPRAGRGLHIDLAAPGVDLWSARPGGGHAYLSGTSHAVPFVTAALALESAAELRQRARDLGPPGRDPIFGRGLLQSGGCGGGG